MIIYNYANIKEKRKDEIRHLSRHDMLMEIVSNMFDWKNFPSSIHTEFIEFYLLVCGECAIWENGDEGFVVSLCERAGSPNANGLGRNLICVTENGTSKTFIDFENENSEDYNKVVYIKNNKFATSDFYIGSTGDLMGDLDTSLKQIIINARYSPLAMARNKKVADLISDSYKGIENGALHCVYTEGGLLDGEEKPVEIVQITDPDMSDKIQYLTKAQDDILRSFYNYYGMDISGGTKLAQQSVEEINAGGNSAMIVPTGRLEERQKAVDKCNKLFDWNCSVEYSKCWTREELKVEKQITEDTEETEDTEDNSDNESFVDKTTENE
ncbi:MAG: hypothetical protein KBT03_00495 [Bacteroidales bacterium]|nr:hypothetical protein [Candidatus Scybalousia scybalohippi]